MNRCACQKHCRREVMLARAGNSALQGGGGGGDAVSVLEANGDGWLHLRVDVTRLAYTDTADSPGFWDRLELRDASGGWPGCTWRQHAVNLDGFTLCDATLAPCWCDCMLRERHTCTAVGRCRCSLAVMLQGAASVC